MDCFEAAPDGEARRAVVVIQEAFGVNEHIRDVATRFAKEGYRAIAPALFHRTGGGTAAYDDYAKVMPMMQALTDDGILADVDTVLAHLHDEGFTDDRIGIVGFCLGGRVTFLVGVRRALGAAVGFYGGGIVTPRMPGQTKLVDEAGALQTPWLGLFGDRDQSITIEDVETLRRALDAAKPDHDIVRYADAEHGFFCDKRPSYNADAAADAWPRALAWFENHLAR
ncbi:MAG: dienelactone hydrolase family protein [Actinobacteria bacterium]|nr:dienelactone hydrolase family protein [Actinomycetota bacterium]